MNYNLIPIGYCKEADGEFWLEVLPEYRRAMEGLEEHSCLQILWWFDQCDDRESRGKLIEEKPYKNGPEILGTFATRSPERPNPIAVSAVFPFTVMQMILTFPQKGI